MYLERKKRPRQATDAVRFTMNCARSLRENIRLLIEKRKAGQRGYATVLNGFLANAQSHLQLVWRKPGQLRIETVRRQDSPAAILGPVAESAADLLATADFRFVKRCESETCVLWFSDQTKSHRRRWCSTMLCGNRHKVAAYEGAAMKVVAARNGFRGPAQCE